MEKNIDKNIKIDIKNTILESINNNCLSTAYLLSYVNFLTKNNYDSLNLLNRSYHLRNKDYKEYEISVKDMKGTFNFEDKIYKVLLTCNWCDSKTLCDTWNKMSKGNYTWNNIQIVWEEPCDYYVVINKPYGNFSPPIEKCIIFHQEPYMTEENWGKWASPENSFYLGSHKLTYNNNEWHIGKSYNELLKLKIDKTYTSEISTILSDKYTDIGQIHRIDFAKFLERKNIPIHVYGGNKFNWKDYKGELPYHQKDDGLLPYKYTFNAENNSIDNYYTEKIIDAILSECLIFYWGCPNINNFIDERAYIKLNMDNFEESLEIINKAINEDWWSDRIEYIRNTKTKILNELQFFPRIEKIIQG
jgi:hypothetical protein